MTTAFFGRCRYCSTKVKCVRAHRTDRLMLVDHAPGFTLPRRGVRDCDGSRTTMFDPIKDPV